MDFDFSKDDELEGIYKEIDELSKLYIKKGFNSFDTWYMSPEELIEIYKRCIKENKSYEEIYDDEPYNMINDY